MLLLQILVKHWRIISIIMVLIITFGAGYKLRSLQERAALVTRIDHLRDVGNMVANHYENDLAALNVETEKLIENLKVTYAQPDNRCLIPADGLRIIQQANQ